MTPTELVAVMNVLVPRALEGRGETATTTYISLRRKTKKRR